MRELSPAYRFLLAGFLWSFGGNLLFAATLALYALGIAFWPWAFAKASPPGAAPGGEGRGAP
uniref:Uncharacterized protein n=1 Tax=Thermus islandicus TaxID=540988 RepID=A0A7C2BZ54_9DEIN